VRGHLTLEFVRDAGPDWPPHAAPNASFVERAPSTPQDVRLYDAEGKLAAVLDDYRQRTPWLVAPQTHPGTAAVVVVLVAVSLSLVAGLLVLRLRSPVLFVVSVSIGGPKDTTPSASPSSPAERPGTVSSTSSHYGAAGDSASAADVPYQSGVV